LAQNIKIAESSVFNFLKLFVRHSSGENRQNEGKQLSVWIFIVQDKVDCQITFDICCAFLWSSRAPDLHSSICEQNRIHQNCIFRISSYIVSCISC